MAVPRTCSGSQVPCDLAFQHQARGGIKWKFLFPSSHTWCYGVVTQTVVVYGEMTSISCVYNALCLTSFRPDHQGEERMGRKAQRSEGDGQREGGRETGEMRREQEQW